MTTTTPTYTQARWSLADLFPSHTGPEMEAALERLEAHVAEIEAVRPQLKPDISTEAFMDIVAMMEASSRLAYRIYAFASLRFNEDTQNQDAQTFLARTQQTMASLTNRTLFFELWWKGLEEAEAERLKAISGDYAYWLEEMRNFKPYTLTEPEEKILNIKNVTGSTALKTLYDTITNRYTFELAVNGDVKSLTRDALMVYVHGPDPDLRAAAYQELFRVFGQDGSILGQMYQTLVRDWHNEQIDLRGFSSPMSVRNLINDIPDEVVDTLLEVCQRNASLFQRYFRLKARWLGVDKLRRYDIYAPVAAADKTYEFSTAVEMVLESFSTFEPKLADMVRQVMIAGHLDSEVRQGKTGGAFCYSVTPDLTPWVLVNYQGRANDVATLAHEMGHAIHSMLAAEADHNVFTFHAPLPLAETASTFGELMLIDRLLAEETDEAVRRDILFRQVDDAYATIMRQAFFALFERQAHKLVQEGASVDELAKVYMENLAAQFGDALEISDEFRWEWVSIWHMYNVPFYVYAYTFGQLLVLSLYQQYKVEGEAFKPRYLKILAAGGSDAPARVLSDAGLDIHSADFWQGGFDVIERLLEDLEKIPIPS